MRRPCLSRQLRAFVAVLCLFGLSGGEHPDEHTLFVPGLCAGVSTARQAYLLPCDGGGRRFGPLLAERDDEAMGTRIQLHEQPPQGEWAFYFEPGELRWASREVRWLRASGSEVVLDHGTPANGTLWEYGIGTVVRSGGWEVVAVSTVAESAGVRTGDVVVRLDRAPLPQTQLRCHMDLLQGAGPTGESLVVTLKRDDGAERDVELERHEFATSSAQRWSDICKTGGE